MFLMSFCQGIKCTDKDDRCPGWASRGRCKTDQWVYRNCLLSCVRTDLCDIKQPIPSGMVPVDVYFLFQTPCHILRAVSRFHFCHCFCLLLSLGSCSEPFGLGWDRALPDSSFQASSTFRPGMRSAARWKV